MRSSPCVTRRHPPYHHSILLSSLLSLIDSSAIALTFGMLVPAVFLLSFKDSALCCLWRFGGLYCISLDFHQRSNLWEPDHGVRSLYFRLVAHQTNSPSPHLRLDRLSFNRSGCCRPASLCNISRREPEYCRGHHCHCSHMLTDLYLWHNYIPHLPTLCLDPTDHRCQHSLRCLCQGFRPVRSVLR